MAFSYSSQLLTFFLILLIVHPAFGDLKGPADDVGLALLANNQVLRNTSGTYQFIVELLASTDEPVMKAALETCRISCSQVRQAFVQAISYFNQKDYTNMVEAERAAPRGEASCRPPTPDSPLVERKRELRILIAMAAVAGHVLAT